jgi:putative colanic acid biosysnthesis UDP-glucose lipid carrier transferase
MDCDLYRLNVCSMLKSTPTPPKDAFAVTAVPSPSPIATLLSLQRLTDPLLVFGLLPLLSAYYKVVLNSDFIFLGIIACLLVLPVFKAIGRYRPSHTANARREWQRIIAGWAIILGILLFLGYSTKTSAIFSRRLVLTWSLLVPIVLYCWHLCMLSILHRILQAGYTNRRAVIVGQGAAGQYLAHQLQSLPELGVELLGYFVPDVSIAAGDNPAGRPPLDNRRFNPCSGPTVQSLGWVNHPPKALFLSTSRRRQTANVASEESLPVLGHFSDLSTYIRTHPIDCVYITPPVADTDLTELVTTLQDLPTTVYVVPNVWMFNLLRSKVHRVNGISMIALWETPLYDLQYDLKRLVDITLSLGALLVLAPLLMAIGLAVKLSSPGPMLFRQRRYGLNGQDIVVYKFRSMTVMEDGSEVRQAQKHDRRITPLGKILRRTSLDELPQLINVLQGRMSIVGPRPHAVAHNELYRTQIDGYMLRHKVKPGITGWAQVHGLRGETDTLEKMQKRIQYDLDYINRWSLWLDLQIIVQTFVVVFTRQNAY